MERSQTVPAVSIIIPVYNVENYLEECLDSLLAQTMQDFEIICVDDGSTDHSYEILKRYAQQDTRIQILQQKNQYAGVARNRGLAIAQGEYVIFLDSDDFFAPQFLELMLQAAREHQTDVVLCGGRRYNSQTRILSEKHDFLRNEFLPSQPIFSRADIPHTLLRVTTPAPWNKLFSRSFLLRTGLQFQALPNSNDFYFVLSALSLADRICAVDADLVYYRINLPNSTQGTKQSFPLSCLQAIYALYEELVARGIYKELEHSFLHVALSSVLFNLRSMRTDKARIQIIEALTSEPYCQIPLLAREEDFYVDALTFIYAKQVTAAITQYKRIRYTQQIPAPEVCRAYRANNPICVSVVIPVYNTEQYLDETLASITGQTLADLEIICINDGSKDASLEILKSWADRDPRIAVYTQPNLGLSVTRNHGIELAHGEYLYFMDSDDILELDALERLYQTAKQHRLDLLCFDGVSFYESEKLAQSHKGVSSSYSRSSAYDGLQDGATLLRRLQEANQYCPSACLYLSRTAFIQQNHFSFHPGMIYEDNAFLFAILLTAKRVSHMNVAFFHRRVRDFSIMTSKATFWQSYSYFVAFQDMQKSFQEHEADLSPQNRSAAERRLYQTLKNARVSYANLPLREIGGELGLIYDYTAFQVLIAEPGKLRREAQDLSRKLQQAYMEKSEINRRLQQTYAEKSEINCKLQNTYREKAERGIKIKRLESEKAQRGTKIKQLEAENKSLRKQLKKAQSQNKQLKASLSYRIGHMLTWPARKLRALLRK